MKKLYFLIALTVFSMNCFSQTDYYRYNRNGVPEKVGYTTPSNTNTFSPYVPRYDANLYREVLQSKQAAYERNLSDINDLIGDIERSMKYLNRVNSTVADEYTVHINNYLKTVSRADYSNFQTAALSNER